MTKQTVSERDFLMLLDGLVIKHGTQKAAAQALGVSPQYFGDVWHGRREPGKRILTAMGYRRVVAYEKVKP